MLSSGLRTVQHLCSPNSAHRLSCRWTDGQNIPAGAGGPKFHKRLVHLGERERGRRRGGRWRRRAQERGAPGAGVGRDERRPGQRGAAPEPLVLQERREHLGGAGRVGRHCIFAKLGLKYLRESVIFRKKNGSVGKSLTENFFKTCLGVFFSTCV